MPREVLAQVGRGQPGLPVVRVDDVDRRRLLRRPLQRGDDQEREAQGVVGEVDAAAVVEPGRGGRAAGIRRASPAPRRRAALRTAPRQRRPRPTRRRYVVPPLPGRDAGIARREQGHLVAEPAKGARQRAGHVGQAARLRERRRFGGDHQHPKRRGRRGALGADDRGRCGRGRHGLLRYRSRAAQDEGLSFVESRPWPLPLDPERAAPREIAALADLAAQHPELAPAVVARARAARRRTPAPAADRHAVDRGHRRRPVGAAGARRVPGRTGVTSGSTGPRCGCGSARSSTCCAATTCWTPTTPGACRRSTGAPSCRRRGGRWFESAPGRPARRRPRRRSGARRRAGAVGAAVPDARGRRPAAARVGGDSGPRQPARCAAGGRCSRCSASAGDRRLVCGRCHGRWPFEPRRCHHCLSADHIRVFSAHDGVYQVTACESCRRYLKGLDVKRAGRPLFLPLDTVATLALDQAVVEQGYQAG